MSKEDRDKLTPYQFYTQYIKVVDKDGNVHPATTSMTEEEFNKWYEDNKHIQLFNKNRRRK